MTRPTRERVDGILERDGGNNGAVSDLCAEVAALRAALAQAEEELSAERDWKVDAIKFREHQDIVKEELRAQVERLREELAVTAAESEARRLVLSTAVEAERELNDELDALEAENERLLCAETDLTAEVERLRADMAATKARWAGELDEKYCAEKWGGDPQYAVFRKRMLDAQAEVERLQRAAVPGNGPEMLRMQVALKRSEAEVERLKAELERVSGGRMRDLLTDAEELCKQRYTQLRELREAVSGAVETLQACAYGWGDRDELRYVLRKLEAVLAKAGGQ